MVPRNISPFLRQSKKSILLLGPRQVGKSTLINSLKPDLQINLKDMHQFYEYSTNSNRLREVIETQKPRSVFIDEVQHYSPILNTVQVLQDERKSLKFFLTGSSARKLKRGNANLLPGRVVNFFLGTLVASELEYRMDEKTALAFGALPEIYLEKDRAVKIKILESYVINYLQEEIRAEALVKNIDSFSRAIPVAIQTSGLFLDYSKLAKKAKVSRHALARFYEIFEDTLIGHRVWPDERLLEKADLVKHPKFYVFDVGIYNSFVQNYNFSVDRAGILFELFFFNQLLHSAWSKDQRITVTSFRTRGGLEVDFIVTLENERWAIEVKSSESVGAEDVASCIAVKQEYESSIKPLVVYRGKEPKKINGVWCLPWQKALKELGL